MDNKLLLKRLDELENIDINLFEIYGCFLDNTMVGYLLIKKEQSNIDNIYIKVLDNYTSMGYGNLLFIKGLNMLKEKNFKDLILNINKDDYRMISIIKKNKGIELSTNNGIKEFLIKLD